MAELGDASNSDSDRPKRLGPVKTVPSKVKAQSPLKSSLARSNDFFGSDSQLFSRYDAGPSTQSFSRGMISPGIPDIRTRFNKDTDIVSSKIGHVKFEDDFMGSDKQGYEPIYRTNSTIKRQMQRNNSKDLFKDQRRPNTSEGDNSSWKSNYESVEELEAFRPMSKNRSQENMIRPQPPRQQNNRSRSIVNQSVVQGADEVNNIVLLFRIIVAYYQNISMTVRRILLSLGSSVDRQRELQYRINQAGLEQILNPNQQAEQLNHQLTRADACNLFQLLAGVAIVVMLLVYLYKPSS